MADRENSIKTRVEIDANQAQQEIAKLNAIASDSTQEVVTRLSAKNKQTEIQNKLSDKTIDDLTEELKLLEGVGASEKELTRAKKKLNAAKLKATKQTAANEKAQRKLNEAYKDSKNPIKGLDDATGGLIGQMNAFLANPIGVAITAIVAAFKLFQKAVQRSEVATEAFNKVGAFLEGIFNGILAILEPLVEFIGTALVSAIENPKQAFIDLGNIIKENILNRVKALLVLGDALTALFDGDFKKAGKLAADGFIQLGTGVENATDKVKDFADTVVDNYNDAADATYDLANAQRQLVKNQIELDKNQLQFQKRAEELRQIRDDTSLSIERRIEANKELGNVLEEQSRAELSLAQQNLELARRRIEAEGDTIENIQAVGDAEIKVAEIQERITSQRSEQLVNINSLLDEQALKEEQAANARESRRKAEAKAEEQREKERIAKEQERQEKELEAQLELDEIEIERRREKGERVLELELELLERRKEQELAQEDLLESERTAIIESYALKAERIKNAEADAKSAAENKYKENAIAAAGEAFGISKELSLAQMLISLPETISNSIKSGAGLPFPANVAAVATNLATQVPPIVKGIQTIKSVQGPSGSTGGGGGSSASVATGGATAAITDIAANNAARLGQDPSLSQNSTQTASAAVSGMSKANVVFSEDSYNDFQGQVQYKEDKTSF